MRRLYFNSISKPLQPCMQCFLFLPKAFVGRVFSWKTGTRSGRESFCSLPGLPRNQVCQETRETRCKFVAKFCLLLCLFVCLFGWLVGLALGWERQSMSMSKVESDGALAVSIKRIEKENRYSITERNQEESWGCCLFQAIRRGWKTLLGDGQKVLSCCCFLFHVLSEF